ncbi:MAG TPA: hypothetical protein VGU23_07850, partial [Acidobacteriaceae bacterium]|nr:hypothetical protein [Acidobacteriaceae bacterium]
ADATGRPGPADGTGFLVSIPTPSNPNSFWLYLVTAKHVVLTDSNNFSSPLRDRIWIRINKKGGGFGMYNIPLVGAGQVQSQTVYLNPDPGIDIAVVPIQPSDPDSFDLKVLPEEMLASGDDIQKLHIGVGTDMFFTGMFTPFLGEQKSYPIVRFGKLAMLPDEKITFAGVPTEGYLMEAFSFGGNSGSPVFFYPSADNTPGSMMLGPVPIKIAGVMKGFFGDIEPIGLLQPSTALPNQAIPVSKENSGIALVVPAKFIKEILDSPALDAIRQRDVQNLTPPSHASAK